MRSRQGSMKAAVWLPPVLEATQVRAIHGGRNGLHLNGGGVGIAGISQGAAQLGAQTQIVKLDGPVITSTASSKLRGVSISVFMNFFQAKTKRCRLPSKGKKQNATTRA